MEAVAGAGSHAVNGASVNGAGRRPRGRAPRGSAHLQRAGTREDVSLAGALARRSLRRLLRTADGQEIAAYVLDGRLAGERSAAGQARMDNALAASRASEVENPGPAFEAASPGLLPERVRAATVLLAQEPPRVLLSCAAGLREMILLAQDACCDALVARARRLGVRPPEHDVARRLADTIRLGGRLAPIPVRRPAEGIRIAVRGRLALALPRPAPIRPRRSTQADT